MHRRSRKLILFLVGAVTIVGVGRWGLHRMDAAAQLARELSIHLHWQRSQDGTVNFTSDKDVQQFLSKCSSTPTFDMWDSVVFVATKSVSTNRRPVAVVARPLCIDTVFLFNDGEREHAAYSSLSKDADYEAIHNFVLRGTNSGIRFSMPEDAVFVYRGRVIRQQSRAASVP